MPQPSRIDRFADTRDRALCRRLIRQGSKSFYAASLLLPKATRDPAYAVYAFCRVADDAVDLGGDMEMALARLRGRLEAVYTGRPINHSADRALAGVVREFDIPKPLFDALLEGFAWDVEGRRYETVEDLFEYAARVAGTVGAIMTLLMNRRDEGTLARACDLGVAMQLTNIARDVGEDARDGRVYLPLEWMAEAGVDPEAFLACPVPSDALTSVVARLLRVAETLYTRAGSGVAALPVGCRPAINAARRIYAEIGNEVSRNGFESVAKRAVVPTRRKLSLLMASSLESLVLRKTSYEPALPQTEFLVNAAVRSAPLSVTPVSSGVFSIIDDTAGRMLEMMMELDRRERLQDQLADAEFSAPVPEMGRAR